MGVIQTTSKELTVDLPNLTITNNETGQVKPIIVRYNKDGTIAGPSLTSYYPFDNGTIIQFKPVMVDGVRQGGQIAVDVLGGKTIPLVTGWVIQEQPEKFDTTWLVDLLGGALIGKGAGGDGSGPVEDIIEIEEIIDPGVNPSGLDSTIPGPLVYGPGQWPDSG